jgi:MoaA/NifB/PqqE/SkfB family radical SAM enzyme
MGVKAVTFSGGGEPFLYDHFNETVKWLTHSPIKFAALTNGSLMTGEVAEMFSDYGTWLRVSMDGYDDASYSRIRRVKDGEYTKIMKNIKAFALLDGACELGVSLVVGRENASHVYDAVSALLDAGVRNVKISPCIISNDGRENNRYHQTIFTTVRAQIRRLSESLTDFSKHVYDAYHELDEKFEKQYHWCPYLQILPVIGADCRVYSCQDKAYTKAGQIGTIRERSFREFWENAGHIFQNIDPSRDCSHHCVANAKNILVHEYLDADPDHLVFV